MPAPNLLRFHDLGRQLGENKFLLLKPWHEAPNPWHFVTAVLATDTRATFMD